MLYITVIKLKLGNCSFLLFSCLNIISQIYDPSVAHIWTYAAHLKLFGKVVVVAAASSTTCQDWPRGGTGGKTGGFWYFASLGNLYRNKRGPTSDAVSRFSLKRSVVISAVASWLTNLTLAS